MTDHSDIPSVWHKFAAYLAHEKGKEILPKEMEEGIKDFTNSIRSELGVSSDEVSDMEILALVERAAENDPEVMQKLRESC